MNIEKFNELAEEYNAFDFTVPMEASEDFKKYLDSLGYIYEKGHNITFDIVEEHHNWFMRTFFNKKNKYFVQDGRGHICIQDIDTFMGLDKVYCFTYAVAKSRRALVAHEAAR